MKPGAQRPAGRVVDVHCHWFPEGLIRLLERDGARHGIEVRPLPSGDRGMQFIRWYHPPLHPFVDVAHRLEYMDRVGVHTHVVTLSGQVTPIWVEAGFGLAMAQVANDEFAALQAKQPDRFVGAAAVPPDPGDCCKAADRLTEALAGIQGHISPSHVGKGSQDIRRSLPKVCVFTIPCRLLPEKINPVATARKATITSHVAFRLGFEDRRVRGAMLPSLLPNSSDSGKFPVTQRL